MKHMNSKKNKYLALILILILICCNMSVYAEELDDDEIDNKAKELLKLKIMENGSNILKVNQ